MVVEGPGLLRRSDRDGVMNFWSMDERGGGLTQHTKHRDFEVQSPSSSNGRIAYQLVPTFGCSTSHQAPTRSCRSRWCRIQSASRTMGEERRSTGSPRPTVALRDRVALTARGQVFVAPAQQGRIVEATRNKLARHRNARFMPDGKTVVTLSDESGEIEFWQVPANGVGVRLRS